MKIGDLVDDGFENLGIIVALGWMFPDSGKRLPAYQVHFLSAPEYNGWYDDDDLKLISQPVEETCK
jgi:hypothetical protein